MSSNAPRVDRASSLSKAADLGGCIVFYLEALGREGGVLQNMGMKSGFHYALLRDGYFAAVFLF